MNNRILCSLLTFLLLVIYVKNINAQGNYNYQELIKECEDLITKRMESDHIIGVSAAIMVNDSVIWKKGFGYADKENEVPMTENTVANIASVTKTFTALAIMQLQEQGSLDINKPLNLYLPQFHPKTRGEDLEQLTIKRVITHSSGMQTDILKNSDSGSGNYTDVLGYINETYLMYPPGMVESYSSAGYNILGHLIKNVSRQDYPEYIHDNILTPFGMVHSGFLKDSLLNRTKVYAQGESMHEYGFRDIASGGIYSSINDLILYARGLMDAYKGKNNTVVKTELIREMFTYLPHQVLIESNKKGLGWYTFENDSVLAVSHAGDAVTGHSILCLIPEENTAAMILINSAEGESLKSKFFSTLISKFGLRVSDVIPPNVINEVQKNVELINLPEETLKKHAGDYSQGFSYLTVSKEGNNLAINRDNTSYILRPLSENKFVPYEKTGLDSMVEKTNEKYFFIDTCGFHMLFHKTATRETRLGYKLNKFPASAFSEKLGEYEHFGYQLLIGDTKFKGAELSLDKNRVMILKLIAYDGEYPFTINVISDEYAVACSLGAGYDFTVKFSEDKDYYILDFGGLTFRKSK